MTVREILDELDAIEESFKRRVRKLKKTLPATAKELDAAEELLRRRVQKLKRRIRTACRPPVVRDEEATDGTGTVVSAGADGSEGHSSKRLQHVPAHAKRLRSSDN